MKFVYGKTLFEKFYELSSKAKEKAHIISAYVGKDSYELLSENVKDIEDVRFIVNFSKENVATCAISPNGIKQLKAIGDVHNREDLHAKLYLFDDAAIITSANFSRNAFRTNLEVGIIIDKPTIIQEIEKFFDELWRKSKPITTADIDEMEKVQKHYKNIRQKHGIPESEAYPKMKKPVITIPKWEEPIDFSKEKHFIINVNWNPHKFEKICSQSEKTSDEQLRYCHEVKRCINWGAGDGCTSATLFKNFKYAISKNAIKRGRITFFIARNPHIDGEYYIVGFFTMKSNKSEGLAWDSKNFYYFRGNPAKSVRLPSKGKSVVKFDRALINKLDNFIDWSKKPKNQENADYIGVCTHTPHRRISNKDAKIILQECYAKTNNKTIKQILEEDF